MPGPVIVWRLPEDAERSSPRSPRRRRSPADVAMEPVHPDDHPSGVASAPPRHYDRGPQPGAAASRAGRSGSRCHTSSYFVWMFLLYPAVLLDGQRQLRRYGSAHVPRAAGRRSSATTVSRRVLAAHRHHQPAAVEVRPAGHERRPRAPAFVVPDLVRRVIRIVRLGTVQPAATRSGINHPVVPTRVREQRSRRRHGSPAPPEPA